MSLGGKESSKPGKTFSAPCDEPVPATLAGVEGARGSNYAAPELSEPPAKSPHPESGLFGNAKRPDPAVHGRGGDSDLRLIVQRFRGLHHATWRWCWPWSAGGTWRRNDRRSSNGSTLELA